MGEHSQTQSHRKPDFGHDTASTYDNNNLFMAPIQNNLLYLINAILNDLPSKAKILSVGAGTGIEIMNIAATYPQFSFTAVEPSAAMLAVCRGRMEKLGMLHNCDLLQGYVGDLPTEDVFDAALSLLVTHHASVSDKKKILEGVASRLKPNGYFILAEMSFDYSSDQVDDILEKWKAFVRLSGAAEDKVQRLPGLFKEHLSILAPAQTEELLRTHGFGKAVPFFQSLLIRAWYCRKG